MARRRTPKALLVLVGGLAAAWMLVAPVQSQGPGNSQGLQVGLYKGHEVAAGEVLVKLHENARRAPMAQELDVDRDELVGNGSIRRIHSRSHDVEALIARLSASADVEYVEPNYVVHALEDPPTDYDGSLLWGLAKISAPLAWAITQGAASNVVGVVDTGIDYTHPDLEANVWSAPHEFLVDIGGVRVTCAAESHGFNAIRKTCDPMDDNNHGSHVSGTIGAVGNNGGIVGVNPVARIMGLKFLNRQGSGTTSDAIDAIEFAIQARTSAGANVGVLSNSWGGGALSQSLLEEIRKAEGVGMLFVAAAGNSGRNIDEYPHYPASYGAKKYGLKNVVAVAATDRNDTLASWSNYGPVGVDLAAPGVDIYSTIRGGRYGMMSGTSMATPHVSGAAALVLSVCGNLTPVLLKRTLAGVGQTDPITGLVGKVLTGGRLNTDKAVKTNCASPPVLPEPPADFSISADPALLSAKRGETKTSSVTISPVGGFDDTVALTVTAPTAVTATLAASELTGPETTILTVTPTSSAKAGWTYSVKITGTSGPLLVHSTTVRVSVTR